MKKFIASVALSILASVSFAKEWKTLRVGVEGAYPPFSSVNKKGELVGFDIDFTYAVCAAMGVKCVLVVQDWDGMIPALLARKYDAIIASMSITDERKKKVDFSNKYYATPVRFVARKGQFSDIKPASLKGKSVGVQRAATHDGYVTDLYGDVVDVKRYGTIEEARLDLISGRIDLVLADVMTSDASLLKAEGGDQFEFVGPEINDVKYFGVGVGIAVRKQDKDLKTLLNQTIKDIRNSGQYDHIRKRYFDFDIYGG